SKKTADPRHFFANLISKGNKKYEKLDIKNKNSAEQILNDLKGASYEVLEIESKERRRSSLPPYATSTLQQDASRRINFYAAKTMKVAQKLYEGVPIGKEGNIGLITYMRTDSLNIAESARKEAREYIKNRYGENFLPEKPKIYKTKSKGAQEAHEAIRPTSVKRTPEQIKQYLSQEEYKLYDLIWRRFVASQMNDALFDTVSVDIKAKEYIFRSTGSTLKFKGFLEVYEIKEDDEKSESLPVLNEKEILNLINLANDQHFTEPPPRYNEASLIKTLEEQGIGRPSTYASIIYTIMQRTYTRLEQKRFYPTNLGILVSNLLKKYFNEIVDIKFTAGIEENLDLVAEGKTEWVTMVKKFYGPFKKELSDAEKLIVRQKVEPEKTNEICPKCGKPMVLRDSPRGQFLACSGFPECRTTFSLDREGNKIEKVKPEMTDIKCEKCGKPMLKRVGKRGPFLACSGFPKCRNIKKIKEPGTAEPKKDSSKPS
ncbi:MAG: type I DNA topoisomerase, partial [Elusimicrobia bacterium]|nr:type I DNA topoisomerase [Elusimicrobiota bacterium]